MLNQNLEMICISEPLKPIYLLKATNVNPDKPRDYGGYFMEPKLDGVAAQIVVNGLNDIRIFSTNVIKETGTFNEYTYKVPHIVNAAKYQLAGVPAVYHRQIYQGELIVKPMKGSSREEDSRYVSGTLNAKDAFQRQQAGRPLHFVCYNIPTMYDQPYAIIISRISALFPLTLTDNDTWIVSVPFEIAASAEDVQKHYEKIVKAGGEGIVVYHPYAKYKFSSRDNPRHKDIIKIKDGTTIEVKITEIVEGTGKYAGTVGALVCSDGKGRDKVRIGSLEGFTDAQRKEIWDMRAQLPFIAEMKYHDITKSSYRNCRLVRIRTDKSIDEWTPGN